MFPENNSCQIEPGNMSLRTAVFFIAIGLSVVATFNNDLYTVLVQLENFVKVNEEQTQINAAQAQAIAEYNNTITALKKADEECKRSIEAFNETVQQQRSDIESLSSRLDEKVQALNKSESPLLEGCRMVLQSSPRLQTKQPKNNPQWQ